MYLYFWWAIWTNFKDMKHFVQVMHWFYMVWNRRPGPFLKGQLCTLQERKKVWTPCPSVCRCLAWCFIFCIGFQWFPMADPPFPTYSIYTFVKSLNPVLGVCRCLVWRPSCFLPLLILIPILQRSAAILVLKDDLGLVGKYFTRLFNSAVNIKAQQKRLFV